MNGIYEEINDVNTIKLYDPRFIYKLLPYLMSCEIVNVIMDSKQ